MVEGDPELLRSSFENVIRNAVRYSPAAAHVGITARRLAGGGDYEEAVEIIIYDQGPGVPEKDLELIFEAFYRVDAARDRAVGGEGTGTGDRGPRSGAARRRHRGSQPASGRAGGDDHAAAARARHIRSLISVGPGGSSE